MRLLIELLFFITIFLFCFLLLSQFNRKSVTRLKKHIKHTKDNNYKKNRDHKYIFKKFINSIIDQFKRIVYLKNITNKLRIKLIKTDIPLRAEEVILIIFITTILVLTISYLLIEIVFISIILSLATPYIFLLYIKNNQKKRMDNINKQLGDALNMMSGSLRAGHSITQALETIGNEMPMPISKEFTRVIQELQLGFSMEEAFRNLLDRVPIDDLEMLITALLIQREIGGNLSEILDSISSTIRQRIQLKGEVKSLTAQGRISGMIIGLLPVFLALLFIIFNPEYIRTLVSNPLGIAMIIIGVISQLIGFIIIRKIIDIEY